MRGRLVFSLLAPCLALAQSSGTFTTTGSMTIPRAAHTATLLPSGQVLIAGGSQDTSAELYDPSTGTFTPTGNMVAARSGYTATATLLANGQVLIAGGSQDLRAELYDPSTGMFTPTGSMNTAQGCCASPATLLADGRVFKAGNANAEIYDPATGTFTLTSSYTDPTPWWMTATLLPDGRVLLIGCAEADDICPGGAELFDPLTGTFSSTGPPSFHGEVICTATLLTDGTVLVVESTAERLGDVVEVYDSATGTFSVVAKTGATHVLSAAVRLSDGTVLITGGWMFYDNGTAGELYLPATRTVVSAGNMATGRYYHTATLLPDGTVLIAGGCIDDSCKSLTASAEIYTPSVRVARPMLLSTPGDERGPGTILHANTSRKASYGDPAAAGEYLEIYLAGWADGGAIPPQVSIGGRAAAVSYFGPSGYPGVNQINVRVPSGVAPGPAVPVWLTYMGRPSNQVTIGVQ